MNLPFPRLHHTLVALRVGVAVMFMAHAAVRVAGGTIERFAGFLGTLGFPVPIVWVWGITLAELVCGTLLILGVAVPWAAPGLMAVAAGGIVLIHRHNGWFVGEHGSGGMEYAVMLLLALAVVMAAALEKRRAR